MKDWSSLSKWLYPGINVKRWLVVAALAAVSLGIGILLLIGRSLVSKLYNLLQFNSLVYYLVGVFLLIGGSIGLWWGLSKVSTSVMRGVTSQEDRSTPDILWEKRFLSKGPKIVAIGGGTGLSTLLQGVKKYTSNITAIVTVMDDGGSSGRLRRDMDILPPGDIRNCIIALADDESEMGEVFQHRFRGNSELSGHSLGNLIIAGLENMTGQFDRAIEETSNLLNIRGQVVPTTLTNTNLIAELNDGQQIVGESNIGSSSPPVERVKLADPAQPHPKAIEAIQNADIIIIGPGSLYTSLIPNLLVDEVDQEIAKSSATKFFVVNIMTEPGETEGFDALDHLQALSPYLSPQTFDFAVVNVGDMPTKLLNRYAKEGAQKVDNKSLFQYSRGPQVIKGDLVQLVELEGKTTIKHDSHRLAEAIISSTPFH